MISEEQKQTLREAGAAAAVAWAKKEVLNEEHSFRRMAVNTVFANANPENTGSYEENTAWYQGFMAALKLMGWAGDPTIKYKGDWTWKKPNHMSRRAGLGYFFRSFSTASEDTPPSNLNEGV